MLARETACFTGRRGPGERRLLLLTIERRRRIPLCAREEGARRGRCVRTRGNAAGHARHADPESAVAGTDAWLGNHGADSPMVGAGASGQPRGALSRAVSAQASEPDHVVVEDDGEQPAGAVLRTHSGGPALSRHRTPTLATRGARC